MFEQEILALDIDNLGTTYYDTRITCLQLEPEILSPKTDPSWV